MQRPSRIQAFTLVELSVVLVIVGLLVGGILSGKSMIRAAQIRTVATQYARWVGAVGNFKDKYQAIPGDMIDAEDIWGAASTDPATCVTTSTGDQRTCNGNGDQVIQYDGTSPGSNESFRFWQQLSNAGFIDGTYSGIADPGGNYMTNVRNSPSSKLDNSAWWPYYKGTQSGGTTGSNAFNGVYNNTLMFGAGPASASGPILKPKEAYNLDAKVDDGQPATGVVVALGSGGLGYCTNTNDPNNFTAQYLLSSTDITCALFFRQAF